MSKEPKTYTSADDLPFSTVQKDFVKATISVLQKNKSGKEPTIVYLLSGKNVIGLPYEGGEISKEFFLTRVRMTARTLKAEMVITVSSSWTIPPDKVAAYAKGETPYKSLAEHPDRIDIASMIIETPKGYWIGQAPMEKNKMGKLTWIESPEMTGNFSNFLSHPKKPKQ